MRELLESADPRDRSRVVATKLDRPDVSASTTPLLEFTRVSKWYGSVIGLNEVSLRLHAGITGLVGTNGAGKSTLMRIAAGQSKPDLGDARVLGVATTLSAARRHVGYCPDVDRFYEDMSGRQFLVVMAKLCGYSAAAAGSRTESALRRVGMENRAARRVRTYSKGERQRIKVAQALLHDPEILILDEPLNGIDPVGRQEFISLFRELADQGKALLVSSHELEELEKLTNQIIVMGRGRIVATGSLASIRDLLDGFPRTILIRSDQCRGLARAFMGLEEVQGVDLATPNSMHVRTNQSKRFFEHLTTLVLEESYDIEHLETMDESANAVLGYLLQGRGAGMA